MRAALLLSVAFAAMAFAPLGATTHRSGDTPDDYVVLTSAVRHDPTPRCPIAEPTCAPPDPPVLVLAYRESGNGCGFVHAESVPDDSRWRQVHIACLTFGENFTVALSGLSIQLSGYAAGAALSDGPVCEPLETATATLVLEGHVDGVGLSWDGYFTGQGIGFACARHRG